MLELGKTYRTDGVDDEVVEEEGGRRESSVLRAQRSAPNAQSGKFRALRGDLSAQSPVLRI